MKLIKTKITFKMQASKIQRIIVALYSDVVRNLLNQFSVSRVFFNGFDTCSTMFECSNLAFCQKNMEDQSMCTLNSIHVNVLAEKIAFSCTHVMNARKLIKFH
jgi:hypothetical protein